MSTRPPWESDWQRVADRAYAAQHHVSRAMRAARIRQAASAERNLRKRLAQYQPEPYSRYFPHYR